MKITVIGSSHGVPEAHRQCTCLMAEVGENIYFVDMGTPAIDALRTRGLPIDAVKGVFITHMHGDHTNGLISFVDLITWYFKTPDPVICLPDPSAGAVIDAWLKVTLNGAEKPIRYQKTEAGTVYDDGVIRMTAFPTQHCPGSFSYLMEAEGKRVLFTGDLKNPGVDFPAAALAEGAELMICESAHFPATTYLDVPELEKVGKVCVTHYSDRHLASVLQLKQALTERGVPAVIATDDLVLTV